MGRLGAGAMVGLGYRAGPQGPAGAAVERLRLQHALLSKNQTTMRREWNRLHKTV
eukprot:SAG22_NODE_16485_length_324_cov_0.862222_1_plen_54_part_10